MITVFLAMTAMMCNPAYDLENLHPKRETVRELASWYGPRFDGRPMANGERFDSSCPETVAHRYLPIGTRLRLHNLANGKTVDVVVKDRGPNDDEKKAVAVRYIDCSEKVAGPDGLDFKDQGVVFLERTILGGPE